MNQKTKLTVKTEIEVLLPMLPNFVKTTHKDVSLSIAELTNEQLKELGRKWTEALIIKADEKKRQRTRDLNKRIEKGIL